MHNDEIDIDAILDREKVKKTRARRFILEALRNSGPKTAAEIYDLEKAKAQFSLSTVYRACETLSQNGILIKTNLTDDGVARYEFAREQHVHHAICLSCNKIFPIDDCPFGTFDQLMMDKYGFTVKSHRLEIYGYCRECRSKKEI